MASRIVHLPVAPLFFDMAIDADDAMLCGPECDGLWAPGPHHAFCHAFTNEPNGWLKGGGVPLKINDGRPLRHLGCIHWEAKHK